MSETMVDDQVKAPEDSVMTEKQQVSLWHERIKIAKKSQEDWARNSGADRFVEEYNGKFKNLVFHTSKGDIPVPPINEVFSYCQADLSNTYNRDPHISVNPKSGTVKAAKLWEVILNYWWRKLKSKNEIEPEIIDKNLIGYAFHKVGTEPLSGDDGVALDNRETGLYSKRVNWRDLVWNLGAKNPPDDCLWMAQRIVLPLLDVKRRFAVASNLEGTMSPDVDKATFDSSAYKDDIKVAVLWEVWDKMDHQIYLLAEGFPDRFLAPPRPWPAHMIEMGEFPFLMYWDYYSPDSPRPMSAIAPWEPQILEKMILLATAVNHSKRWNRQLLLPKGSMDATSLDKFERGDDGAIIEYVNTGGTVQPVFADFGQLPVDFYLLMDRLSAIERETNGQPEFERGGVTKTGTRTKGELTLIQKGAKGRTNRKIDRFETHLENICRHMLAQLKADFDFKSAVQITGKLDAEVIEALGQNYDPVTGTVTFTPEEIAGEFEAEVKAGSTLPLNQEGKMAALDSVMDRVGNVSSDGVSPLLNAIVTEVLDIYDIKSLKEAYAQEREMEAQKQQMAQQETDADEAKARSQAAKNIAQTDKIGAEADKLRLETAQSPEQMMQMEEAEAEQEMAGAAAE